MSMILRHVDKEFEATARMNHAVCICQSNTRLGAVQGCLELVTKAVAHRDIFDEPITLYKRVRYEKTVPTLYRTDGTGTQLRLPAVDNVVVSEL